MASLADVKSSVDQVKVDVARVAALVDELKSKVDQPTIDALAQAVEDVKSDLAKVA